jgi:aldehyde dehydrogenase (NAD+)
MYIGGNYADSASGKWFDSYNAMREYLQVKSIWINTGAVTGNPFVMR